MNYRQAYWALYLSRFDFILKHVPGTRIEKTDRLSRRLDWEVGIKKDNDNQVFIKNCWLYSLHEVVIERPEVNIVENVVRKRVADKR